MSKYFDAPLKINGKKTKLLAWIDENLPVQFNDFYEPFAGSCVVGSNLASTRCFFNDINPHIIQFYKNLQNETEKSIHHFLSLKGDILKHDGESYYYAIREKFNKFPEEVDKLELLFIIRACFNGLMRFNSKGGFNSPYCKNDQRFSEEYINKVTKLCTKFNDKSKLFNWQFTTGDFEQFIGQAKQGDVIYCDPPYFGLHATYFDKWTEESEARLFNALNETPAYFLMSTWKNNGVRENPMLNKYWNKFNIVEHKHTYRIGAKTENRREVVEVLIKNY
jgi:DNA adenine methylase